MVNCRPPSDFDILVSIVFEYLHEASSFCISCGAKFGSDFLICDGPREDMNNGRKCYFNNVKCFRCVRPIPSTFSHELLPTTLRELSCRFESVESSQSLAGLWASDRVSSAESRTVHIPLER